MVISIVIYSKDKCYFLKHVESIYKPQIFVPQWLIC